MYVALMVLRTVPSLEKVSTWRVSRGSDESEASRTGTVTVKTIMDPGKYPVVGEPVGAPVGLSVVGAAVGADVAYVINAPVEVYRTVGSCDVITTGVA